MRTIDIYDNELIIRGTATLPDSDIYVFNPNYIDISLTGYNGILLITIASRTDSVTIEATLFRGAAHIFISRTLQTLFTDYVTTRSIHVTVTISTADGHTLTTATSTAYWASLAAAHRYGYYLPFVYDRGSNPRYIRDVIWFIHFPFRLSLYRKTKDSDIYARQDNQPTEPLLTNNSVTWTSSSAQSRALSPALRQTTKIDLSQLTEAGVSLDSTAMGIQNITQATGLSAGSLIAYDSEGQRIDFSQYANSGLDLITYNSLYSGKTGIIELTPSRLYPDTANTITLYVMNTAAAPPFDAPFNITFGDIADRAYIVRLTVSRDTAGIYLRWIDHYGFYQYYLFDEGEQSGKSKLNSDTIDAEYSTDGRPHAATRAINIENTDTIKCCASNIHRDLLAYIRTIATSPHIELYLGTDIHGKELWKPVTAAAETAKIAAHRQLYDFEFSFTLPNTETQTI